MSRAISQSQWHQVEQLLRERTRSIAEIAEVTQVSSSSIYRRYPHARTRFGKVVTKRQRLNHDRLRQVEALLRERRLTVAEISNHTGISKSSIYMHFSRPRERFGELRSSPPRWREQARQLLADGKITVDEACERFKVHKSSLYKHARSPNWPANRHNHADAR